MKAEILAEMGNMDEGIKLMNNALITAKRVGKPPLLWEINDSLGLLFE